MTAERKVAVRVSGGLHARPIAEIVRLSKGYQADIRLVANGQEAAARSSLKMLLLGVKEGQEVTLRAEGVDASDAVARLAAFLEEAEMSAPETLPQTAPEVARDLPAGGLAGVPVSGGTAVGPVFAFRQPALDPEPARISAPEIPAQTARAQAARDAVAARLRAEGDSGSREILEALAEQVDDPDWGAAIAEAIAAGSGALRAVLTTSEKIADQIAALADPYARARAEDMRGAGQLVALALQGKRPLTVADVPEGAVLVARDLPAAHIGGADLARLAAIVTASGSANGHAGILTRAAGLPAVFGLGEAAVAQLMTAAQVAVDGDAGTVLADPGPDVLRAHEAARQAAEAERAALAAFRDVRPATLDGVAITVAANIGQLSELDAAQAGGAMGVGLLRTEFLFMNRTRLPDEDEQLSVYTEVLRRFPGGRVVIRTLDIGGDKPLRALPLPPEDNPFLGLRGVRLCLARPELLRPQLRALLRAAPEGALDVMLPMVSDVAELRAVREMIESCRAALTAEGKAHGRFRLGVMIETPAAVFGAAALAREAAFFSIGTNDLTQYVMAADRTNAAVAELSRADHPAVLAAIDMVCAAAAEAGIETAVCGEAGADPALLPRLLRAGVRDLSVTPAALLRVKRQIGALDLTTPSSEATS